MSIAHLLPPALHRRVRQRWGNFRVRPPVGWVRFGSLRRVTPIGPMWPNRRGRPVDRHYIETFLADHAEDVHGRVLELENSVYTRRFGGDRVTHSDILHSPIGRIDPAVTIVADLTRADHIPTDAFDCIILTQTLQFIYELRAALGTLHRILKPGGVLLMTVPGISQITRVDMELWGEYWRFTTQSVEKLCTEVFPAEHVSTVSYGNVLAATAFLHGLAVADVRPSELDHHDPDYQMIVAVRAVK